MTGSSDIARGKECDATTMLLNLGRFERFGMRLEARDSLKSNNRVENKRHANARRALASYSAIGVTPPSPPLILSTWKQCDSVSG